MAGRQESEPVLLVFDFDNTVIDDNVDVAIRSLAPGGDVPESVQSLYNDDNWTEYMGAIFHYLHQQGVSPRDIQQHVQQLPLTPGMKELFDHIRDGARYTTIIISDANSVFIDYLLSQHGLSCVVSEVFTNPAEYDANGCLTIRHYHTQDWCPLSTVNLCKGHILQDYIQQRKQEGVSYKHVIYVGDGSNDLCPGLTLRTEDYLLPRKGFSLWKKLEKMKLKQNGGGSEQVTASVVGWDSAVEIRTLLESISAGK